MLMPLFSFVKYFGEITLIFIKFPVRKKLHLPAGEAFGAKLVLGKFLQGLSKLLV